MIYTCRFCEWQSIYPEKIKEHIEDHHALYTISIMVKESLGVFSATLEDLMKYKIIVCNDRGFLNPDSSPIMNKCRYCSSRFKNIETYRKHIINDHQEIEMDLDIRELGDGYVVTIEELGRKKVFIAA